MEIAIQGGGKRRSEDQYDLALAAEPHRPKLDEDPLKSDKAARHQAMKDWVEMWGGPPLESEERRVAWWKLRKSQFSDLVKAARARYEYGTQQTQSMPAADAGGSQEDAAQPHREASLLSATNHEAPPDGLRRSLCVSSAWVAKHTPAVQHLAIGAPIVPAGEQRATRQMVAQAATPGGSVVQWEADVSYSVAPPARRQRRLRGGAKIGRGSGRWRRSYLWMRPLRREQLRSAQSRRG